MLFALSNASTEFRTIFRNFENLKHIKTLQFRWSYKRSITVLSHILKKNIKSLHNLSELNYEQKRDNNLENHCEEYF